MTQTTDDFDAALAHIRRQTAVPIRRFIDVIAASRTKEAAGDLDEDQAPDRSRSTHLPERAWRALLRLLARST